MGVSHDAVAGGRSDQPRDFRPLIGTSLKDPTTSSEAFFRAAAAVMATQPSEVAQDLPARLLASHYGLNGSINVLSSEIERTTEVSLLDGSRLILKTSARPEAIDSFRFQSEAIAALEGASGFVTPRVVRTGGGTLMFREDGVSGYLQTRLLGSSLHEAPRTSELLYEAGKALGMLDLALRPANLPAMHRPILWHIGCWPKLLELERHLPSAQIAESVRLAMASFSDFIAPQLGNVAWQVVHNDPSPFNTLVTDDGIGFIDFGDGCWGAQDPGSRHCGKSRRKRPLACLGRSGTSDRWLRLGRSTVAAGSNAPRRAYEGAAKRPYFDQLLAGKSLS